MYGRVFFSSLMLVLSGCTPQDKVVSKEKNDAGYIVGWLHGNCIAVQGEVDIKSSTLLVVNLDSNRVEKLEFDQKSKSDDSCYALLEGRASINAKDERYFYMVNSKKSVNLGIGIIFNAADKASNTEVIDLNGDGRNEVFTYCATSEGVQFSIWSGEKYHSDLIWSDYYYLGYDTEADCPLSY